MKLRPYQLEAGDGIMREWETNVSTLVVLPTGLGKTVLFADIIRRKFPRRAMVVAHREELIFQARDKIQAVTGLHAEIEMGELRANMGGGLFGPPCRVVVSTVQTLTAGGDGSGRYTRFDPNHFGTLIIDEAHHATAGSYRKVIDWFTRNESLRVLGVTATPDRTDEEALGQVFGSVAYDFEIWDAIREGWLVPIEQQMVDVDGLDFSGVKTTLGDLNGAELAAVMEREEILHRIASPTIEILGARRAIVFCSSVAHAERLAEIFNRHRSGMASWVCGETDKEDRRRMLADFAGGKIQVICNCGVLTEGFDDWGVEVIVMARPTKSRALYAQMGGRGTRPPPGTVDGPETAAARRAAIAASKKTHCLFLDFVAICGRHKLVSAADILGGNVSDDIVAEAVKKLKSAGKPVNVSEAIEEAQREAKERAEAEAATRARLTLKATYKTRSVNPFDVLEIDPTVSRGWDKGRQLSPKQRDILLKQGINPDGMEFHQAKQMLNEVFRRWDGNLCSYKQAALLKRYGINASSMSREQAKATIDGLAANGWRKPAEVAA